MKLFQNLREILRASEAVGLHALPYWGYCSHCATSTPWKTNVWYGDYRCARCGSDLLANNSGA